MKKYLVYLFVLFLLSAGGLQAQTDPEHIMKSKQIYEWIRNQEFGKVVLEFDSTIAERIDSAKLSEAWVKMHQVTGNFVKVLNMHTEHKPNYDMVVQESEFEKKNVDFKLVFGKNGKIRGILFTPVVQKLTFDYPSYYDSTSFDDYRKLLITGNYKIPAMISIPKSDKKVPVAILVHGSGPNDKDETVGNTKIFRDLAVGLAAQGIAVLRYDKRTRNYAALMQREKNKLTVKEETMDDVISAIELAKQDTSVDSTRIFLIGHSLGGMLLPRIVGKRHDVAGLVFLAANARPMEELMLEQSEYLAANDSNSAYTTEALDSVRQAVQRIKNLKPKPGIDTTGIFGIPDSYWLDLQSYNQVKTAASLKIPMLFLSGGRDYQVTETDFTLWKEGLKSSKYAQFKSYPKANHLFINGEGKSLPDEYNHPGHVDKEVIDDISSFILKGSLPLSKD